MLVLTKQGAFEMLWDESFRPHLVLCSFDMRGGDMINGVQLLEQARKIAGFERLKFILTHDEDMLYSRIAKQLGAKFLKGPFRSDQLSTLIGLMLSKP